jgi:tetratricopeptide (TPR) repeat protein
MKFKPIYLYGILIAAVVVILIIVSQQTSKESSNVNFDQTQNLPDDEVHQQLQNQSSTPGRENVSESFKQKLADLKTTVETNPQDTAAMREYADLLSASHKMDEAVIYYKKILDKDKKRTDIYFSLSLIFYNKNNFAGAEEQNKKVLEYDPENQMALYNIGAIAATQGNTAKAKDFWAKVIELDSLSETGKLAAESLKRLN